MEAGVAHGDNEGVHAAGAGQCRVGGVGVGAGAVDDDVARGGALGDRVGEWIVLGVVTADRPGGDGSAQRVLHHGCAVGVWLKNSRLISRLIAANAAVSPSKGWPPRRWRR